MRIGFDAKRAFANTTGLGNYSRTLIDGLSKKLTEDEFYLFTPYLKFNHLEENSRYHIITPRNYLDQKLHPLWRRGKISQLAKQFDLKLYHGLSNELPLDIDKTGIKSIVTIHDLIFKHFPKQFSWFDRNQFEKKFSHACKVADKVFACSNQTRQDLIDLYGVNKNKIVTMYQSCDPQFYKRYSIDEIKYFKMTYKLPEIYNLYVGSLIERKCPDKLIQALSKMKSNENLVIVGKGPMREKLELISRKLNLDSRVYFLDVPFDKLPLLYQGAKVFIYPSIYEGFGIPLIEAQVSGIPVITSKHSCLPEVAGPHSMLIDPMDIESFAESIDQVSNDASIREKMSSEGMKWCEKFSENEVISRVCEEYQKVLTEIA